MNLKQLGFSRRIKSLFLSICAIIALTTAGSFVMVKTTCAGAPVSPCDPQYMDALEARAWLEAQREISQNQNLIYKPDSVLEYTCFRGFLNEAASEFPANRQFSETDRWGGHPVGFSFATTDEALTQVVLLPMVDYLAANFNTDGFNAGAYLNNRVPLEYLPPLTVDGGEAYGCGQMQAVWEAARCSNFIEQTIFDGFYDFLFYENPDWDPRIEVEPWELMCEQGDPRYEPARITAFNEDQALFDVTTEIFPPQGDGEPYLEDDIITHLEFILPIGACGASLEVPTGVTVQRPDINGGAPYPEHICTNPGCSATPGGGCVP